MVGSEGFPCDSTLTHGTGKPLETQRYGCDPGQGTKLEQFYYLSHHCIYIILPNKKQFDFKVSNVACKTNPYCKFEKKKFLQINTILILD